MLPLSFTLCALLLIFLLSSQTFLYSFKWLFFVAYAKVTTFGCNLSFNVYSSNLLLRGKRVMQNLCETILSSLHTEKQILIRIFTGSTIWHTYIIMLWGFFLVLICYKLLFLIYAFSFLVLLTSTLLYRTLFQIVCFQRHSIHYLTSLLTPIT